MKVIFKSFLASLLFGSSLTFAAQLPQGEIPQFNHIPKNFKLGNQNTQNNVTTMEFVPQNQSVDNWESMITFQVMLGEQPNAIQMMNAMGDLWLKSCPSGNVTPIQEGMENGYPFTFWQMTCDKNPQTDKPEVTWMKTIRGNAALYSGQYAFRHRPNKEEVEQAARYLHTFNLCDTSSAFAKQHPCSRNKKN